MIKSLLIKYPQLYFYILYIISIFMSKKIKKENIDYENELQKYWKRPEEKTYYYKNKIENTDYDLHIIVPAYNVEKYIDECLESILQQKTKYKIFITVVNDGSTDRTGEKLKKYKDIENIEILEQKNEGLSSARNRGLEKMKGKYIMFVDSDDILLENAIEILLDTAIKNDLDIVEGSYCKYINGNLMTNEIRKTSKKVSESDNLNFTGFAWMKVIKNNVLKNLRFPLDYIFEDSIFAYLIYPKKYKGAKLSNLVYGYRYNENSITNTVGTKKNVVETWYITEELIKNGLKLYDISITQKLFLQYLHQIKLNYKRMINCPENIKITVFFLSKQLLEEYFYDFLDTCQNKDNEILCNSLLKGDYGKYKFICKFGGLIRK